MATKHGLKATASNANPSVTATSNTPKTAPPKRQSQSDCEENWGSHKTKMLHLLVKSLASTRFLAISRESDTSCFHPKPSPKASPNVSAIAPYPTGGEQRRTVADGCGRYDNESRTRLYPRTPRVKRVWLGLSSNRQRQRSHVGTS